MNNQFTIPLQKIFLTALCIWCVSLVLPSLFSSNKWLYGYECFAVSCLYSIVIVVHCFQGLDSLGFLCLMSSLANFIFMMVVLGSLKFSLSKGFMFLASMTLIIASVLISLLLNEFQDFHIGSVTWVSSLLIVGVAGVFDVMVKE